MGFLQASWQFLLQTFFSIWRALTACFSSFKSQDLSQDIEKQSRSSSITSSSTSHPVEVQQLPPSSPRATSADSPPVSPKSSPKQSVSAPTTSPIPNPSGATWPPWPQLIYNPATITSDENAKYLKSILSQHGSAALRASWLAVCAELEKITARIALQQTKVIPVLESLDAMLNASEETKNVLREAGCFVVREVIQKQEAEVWAREQKEYVEVNRAMITGMPKETPFMFNVYHSPVQQGARSHPNSLAIQRAINELWHDDSGETSPEPLSYADGFRIRPANTEFTGLPPHIDGGSLSRWADPQYASVYSSIFSGAPLSHDPYALLPRSTALPALFPGANSAVLRSFQGWTALTSAGVGNGSLLLYPEVKIAIAYVLLRPFFSPPAEADVMDASKWTLNEEGGKGWFPGTWRNLPQILSPVSHPHLRLEECMVPIPHMEAGDTVWWHADMIHAVEPLHNGTHDSSVLYIAAVPTTRDNVRYIEQQAVDFRNGVAPEDKQQQGTDERKFIGYRGEEGVTGVAGRRAARLDLA